MEKLMPKGSPLPSMVTEQSQYNNWYKQKLVPYTKESLRKDIECLIELGIIKPEEESGKGET